MGLNLGARGLATILALASLPTAGCSWLFVNKPPKQPIPASPPIECTASVASPVIDTVIAVALAAGGAATIVLSEQNRPSSCAPLAFCEINTMYTVGGALLMAAAIPTAFSAGYGFSKTSDCRLLKEVQLACVSGVETSCAALRGKPAGEDCTADIECGGGNICFRGTCNPKPR
jgi:hypothetical protein